MPLSQFRRALLIIRLFAGVLSIILAVVLFAGLLAFRDRSSASLILGATLALVYGIGGITFLGGLFRRLGRRLEAKIREGEPEPVYGFGALLVAGIGSTMGISMLTVLPYAVRSSSATSTLLAVLLSGSVSLALAQAYGSMGRFSAERGERSVGGPAFVKAAYGIGASYFLSRLSMWVGTTALTAFNLVMSIRFLFSYLPEILQNSGLSREASTAIITCVTYLILLWAFFLFRYESTHRRAVAGVQAGLIVMFLSLLFISVYSFITYSPRPLLPSIETISADFSPMEVIFNAGYIYLVLFGFQEVQALFEESKSEVRLPFIGPVPRERYVGWAMMLTVVLSTAIFSVYTLAISPFDLSGDIPPLEIAIGLGGVPTAVNSALVLLAAITTLTPSYMAAKRHLEELGRDGLVPQSFTKYSWLFTLVVAVIMGLLETDTLVGIADIGILLSLSVIALADLQLRRNIIGLLAAIRDLAVSAVCAIVLITFYLIESLTFVLGIVFLVMNWFVFNVFRLGKGVDLFMATLTFMTYLIIERVEFSQALLGVWITKRVGTILLLLSVVYLVQAIPRLRLDAIWYDFLKLLGRVIGTLVGVFAPLINELKQQMDRASLVRRKYDVVNAAIRLEELKDKNPELYREIEALVRKDLERLLKYSKSGE